jgi:hypothetical protein
MTEPTQAPTPAPAWAPTGRACLSWQADPRAGLLDAGCDDCMARSVAQSPAAWKAAKGITAVELQKLIAHTFGDEHAEQWKRLVWRWMKRLKVGGLAS